MSSEQADNLSRVSRRIGAAILDFCLGHDEFYADELRQFVCERVGHVAPASADRILRDLRRKGRIDYEVLSRRMSHYRVRWVNPAGII